MTRAETRAKNHALRRHVCDCTLEVQPRAYGALYSLLRAVRRGCFHPGTSLAWLWPEVSAIAASEEGEKGILKGHCPQNHLRNGESVSVVAGVSLRPALSKRTPLSLKLSAHSPMADW